MTTHEVELLLRLIELYSIVEGQIPSVQKQTLEEIEEIKRDLRLNAKEEK